MKLDKCLFWLTKNISKDNKDIVAIKKFKENSKSFVKRELKMLNLLKSCEFVVTLKEAYRRKEKIYFIFDYVDKVIFRFNLINMFTLQI
jgi:serine/threonine protein kinase